MQSFPFPVAVKSQVKWSSGICVLLLSLIIVARLLSKTKALPGCEQFNVLNRVQRAAVAKCAAQNGMYKLVLSCSTGVCNKIHNCEFYSVSENVM